MIKALLGTLALCTCLSAQPKEDRPNIVFIMTDDHATQAIGAYGHPIAEIAPTPNLDQLANEGMRFDRCMVTNSICGPSRACILTGKYSHLNGFYDNVSELEFDGSQDTFPKELQKAGYQTALFGKWHLFSDPTGFDQWEVLINQGTYYQPKFDTPSGTITENGYVTDLITEKAINWLETERDPNRPFLLMIQHKAPHREWSPDSKYLDLFEGVEFPEPDTLFDDYSNRGRAAHEQDMSIAITMEEDKDLKLDPFNPKNRFYRVVYSHLTPDEKEKWDVFLKKRQKEFDALPDDEKAVVSWKYQQYMRDYLSCVKSVDDSIGEIEAYLKAHGLDKNTIVMYTSDQGFYLGEHGWFDKRFMYDESYRTPLIVKWPGVVEPGSTNDDLVSNLDFAQTFIDAAGAEAPSEMQGMSLVPLLGGNDADWRKYHYYHYYEYPGWHMVQRHEGVYDGRFKLMHFYDIDEWELYDLESDPKELNNRYGDPEFADDTARLEGALAQLKEQYHVPAEPPAINQPSDPLRYYSSARKQLIKKQARGDK